MSGKNRRPAARGAAMPEGDSARRARPVRWLAGGATLVAALAAAAYLLLAPRASTVSSSFATAATAPTPPRADYVGAAACGQCHESEFKAWLGSHHALAMQAAAASTVLGDFGNAKFRNAGVESTFFRRDDRFMVRTDGPDGKLADYEVKYTFGVTPLQQYLVEFPGGRLQALSIAWDSRPRGAGGQRWFHLYPGERIDHRDALHWTGLYQTWNLQCAACHSTNLRKGYDAAGNAYKTTSSAINVACEACHGPGSRHLEWAKQARPPYSSQGGKGLVILKSRWSEAWKRPAEAKTAERDQPAADALTNICAACHARRSTIADGGAAGAPLEETHRLAMLTPPNYHADGQQREEVYTWGSFLQTRMHQRGVTCMDCHEPHALKLRAPGNALCARCHDAAAFDTEGHHFHKAGAAGAQCVACHMPAQKYMVIDSRRDHGIRVPRPDLSDSLGSPNACTQCHADRKPAWAAAAMDQWYGTAWRGRPQYGATLRTASTQGAKALPSLLALAEQPAAPAIVRATAAVLAQPFVRGDNLPVTRKLLGNAEPMLRIAALGLLEPFEPAVRAQAAAPLLADPVRGVRVEAARLLADIPDASLPATARGGRERATQEYVESLQEDADWPAANASLGNLRMRQGRPAEAIAAYERALFLDSRFAAAYVNLADAYRRQGREVDGEKVLRRGLALLPRAPDLHHALGLALVRKGDKATALQELAAAAKLAPDSARYGYVYAVGLYSAGRRGEALSVLRAAEARHPYDLEILGTLVSMMREAGKPRDALLYARRIAEILPDDPGARHLVAELEQAR